MTERIPFLDLRVTAPDAREALHAALDRVLLHGRVVLGPEVVALETAIAARCGRRFGVGVGSGTDALYLTLRALDLEPGDEVITTAFSWIATANAIRLAGGTPVFADIGDDLNLDPDSASALVTSRTRGILPVHYTGKTCRMADLQALCDRHGLWVVEDAAQAFGAMQHGRPAGSFGLMAAFSMNPMKVFAALGEAGMILTDREDLAERLVALRYNGTLNREVCITPSLNARLDTLQAAFLLVRLEHFDAENAIRRRLAQAYHERLSDLVAVPRESDGSSDVFYTYTIQTDRRDELMAWLAADGIETKVRHPHLMPDQPAYRDSRSDCPNARRLISRILCLPLNEGLALDDVDRVCDAVRRFFRADA